MNKLFKHKEYFFLISLLIIQIILLVLIFIKKIKTRKNHMNPFQQLIGFSAPQFVNHIIHMCVHEIL